MMFKISIIIPAYNVQEYLEECILSILKQSFQEYEVLLIDDCSIDKTDQIIRNYEKKCPEKIRAFYQKSNHKQGSARNIGIKYAKGEYLMFVDSDDILEQNALWEFWESVEKTRADIIFGDYFIFNNQMEKREIHSHISNIVTGKLTTDKKRVLFNTSVVPWAKLIKRSLIINHDLLFPEDIFYEDQATTYLYYLYADSIAKINKATYGYREREDSTTHMFDYNRCMQRLLSAELLIKRMMKRGVYSKYRAEIEYFAVYQMYCLSIESWFATCKNVPDDLLDKARELLYQYGGDYKNNKYYQIGISEHRQRMIEAGRNSNADLRNLIYSCALKNFHTNYSYHLQYCREKIKDLKKYVLSNGIRTVLWGAGKTGANIIKAFHKEGLKVNYITDINQGLCGKYLENYIISEFIDIVDDVDLIIVERTEHTRKIAQIVNNEVPMLNLEIYVQYDLGKNLEAYFEKG